MSTAILNLFSRRLKQRREELRYTLRAIGEAAGVSPSAIGNYESGTNEPDFDTLLKICAKLNVSPSWILGISEKETSRTDGHYEIDLNKEDNDHLKAVCKMSRNPPETIIEMAISYYTKLAKMKKSLPWEPDLKDTGQVSQ